MKLINRMVAVLLLAAGFGCSSTPPPEPVTVPQVVEMSKAGMPATEIIGKLRQSGTVYRLQASQLSELGQQGVAPDVLDYMQETYLKAVREDAIYNSWDYWSPRGGYWYGGPYFGWPNERVIVVRERPPPPPPPPKPPRGKKR